MDLFDLFPIVPPQFPGERSSRDPLEQVAAAVAVGLLPLAGALLVLFSGLKGHAVVALVVMPLVFATVAYLLGRRLSVSVGRSLLLGFGCTTACFVANAGAMLLAAVAGFYSTF
jgi:hypothetical protein